MTKDEKIFCDMQIQNIFDNLDRLSERLDIDIDHDDQFSSIYKALHAIRMHINPNYADFVFNMQLAKIAKEKDETT